MKRFSTLLVFIMSVPLFAVTISDVLEVKQRTEASHTELRDADRRIIEEYWETKINTMLISDKAEDIVSIRRELEEPMGDEPLSFYSSAYIDIAGENLQTAFETIARMEDTEKQQLLKQNMMVLAAQLKSPNLSDIAIQYLDDKNPVVRYWAVKALTNAGVIQMLSSDVTADEETEQKILNALKQRLTFEKQIEIRVMIINFASTMDNSIATEILFMIADERIDAYRKWSFYLEQEALDTKLLIALGNRAMMSQDSESQSTMARKFAEMYSLALQVYIKGADKLDEKQVNYLLTVILEVDRTVLDKMLEVSQTGIFRAIQRQVGLEREYETIFGDRLRAGELGTKFKFDYGKDASGRPITAPPEIGSVPEDLQPAEQ